MEIKNQIAVITGGGSGMGAATAKYLASKGAKVAILDREEDKANNIAAEVNGLVVKCDVVNETDVAEAIQLIQNKLGTPTICVNCAGIAPAKRIIGRDGVMPLEEFKRVIDINLIGTFNVMRLAAAAMAKINPITKGGERGVIINTASVAAYEGQIGQTAYSASKGGIVSMTLPAARELANYGIRVMTIAPGIMDTPMMAAMPTEVQESLAAAIPFPKRLGTAQEFAKLVGHIIENEYLNGSVIRLDGGIRMAAK